MIPDKVLVFDLFGDYAQFKKYFTNMSPLSFSIPSRTVLGGIIGAILGIDKHSNPRFFSEENTWFALQILKPIKKTKIALNNIKTAGSLTSFYNIGSHKPTNLEFLKEVRYRIYVSRNDHEVYDKLKDMLSNHQSVYTVSLGISGCLANYEYIGEYKLKGIAASGFVNLSSVVPMDSVAEIDFSKPMNLQKAKVSMLMSNNREVLKYSDILFEQDGRQISLKPNDVCYVVDNENSDIIHEY